MATPLKDILSDIFAHDTWKYKLLQNWQNIMGPLCDKVRIEKICDDTLILGVTNSCWMQELYLLSPLIIKTINKNLDKPRIKQIRFKRTGRITKKQAKNPTTKKPAHKKNCILTPKQKGALEKIKDPELRKALEKFYKRCYGEQ